MNLTGLTSSEVLASRERHGANKLPASKRVAWLRILIEQFRSPLIFILLIAAGLTSLLGEYIDSAAIILIVLVNTLLGFMQEYRAQRALEALKNMIKPQVRVIRDAEEQTVSAEDLVVGDIVKLKLGERIPADGVVLEANTFTVSEAVLTGEPEAIEKLAVENINTANIPDAAKVSMGTVVLTGYAVMQVRAIGQQTKFGAIARTLSILDSGKTPLQKRLGHFSRQIAIAVGFLAILTFILAYFVADPSTYAHGLNTAQFADSISARLVTLISLSVSLAVAAIPEGLVIGLTVILTLSLQRLLRRKALVRKLVVAETLGSVTTICVDKTGTLTQGEMHVVATDFTDEAIARQALLAVNRDLNAVDAAVGKWLAQQNVSPNINPAADAKSAVRAGEHLFDIPFNSKHKFTASVYENAIFVAGAPEVLLAAIKLEKSELQAIQVKIEAEATQGHRLIAVGYRQLDSDSMPADLKSQPTKVLQSLEWLGTVALEDPIRKDVRSAFELLTAAGISIKVITGDQQTTALNIMREAGIAITESESLSGTDLDALSDAELQKVIKQVKLFYRTVPEQKLRIVELLKRNNEVVAMMGDGINDAPALQQADVGVAVQNATEVSKETADIVLLDNNMHTLAAAVEEGRSIFENMRKLITYLLADGTAEVLLILGSLIFGLPLPLLPLQILFINLVADGFPDIALAFEKAEHVLMRDKPRDPNAKLLDREMITLIGIIGVVVNVFIFAIYVALLRSGASIEYIRSFIFLLLGVDSLLYVFSIRSLRYNIWNKNPLGNWVLNLAVITGLGLMGLAFYVPAIAHALELRVVNASEVLIIILVALVQIAIIEVVKYLFMLRGQSSTIKAAAGLTPR
jgi:P-type Ca2+ transporter type 2C